MSEEQDRIQQLEAAYRKLWEQHLALKDEIKKNYAEFNAIREALEKGQPVAPVKVVSEPVAIEPVKAVVPPPVAAAAAVTEPVKPKPAVPAQPPRKSNWEQYIGEQLLSKIGIAVLIIGVGIGAKYAIDKQLMSPAMRILGGYLIAGVLGFFAYRFRTKYTAFSAILVSGTLAVSYFITYAAHSFYAIYPYWLTFVLLLLITGATVYTALRYNQVIIAHIGLVGAYVLPVLIAAKTSHMSNYLAYMTFINAGILLISFLRSWKSLYHVAFGWTSFVFLQWISWPWGSYNETSDALIALSYATVFFVLFHSAALAYPLMKKQAFTGNNLYLVVPNMIVFTILGQTIIANGLFMQHADALFSFGVAMVFFVLWAIFRSVRPEDALLKETHFVVGLSAFTLAACLELDGAHLHLTLLVEACLLAWLAMRTSWKFMDVFATVILIGAAPVLIYSFFLDWNTRIAAPFLNGPFLVSLVSMLVAGATYEVLRRKFDPALRKGFIIDNGLLLYALIGLFVLLQVEFNLLYDQFYMVVEMTVENWENYDRYVVASSGVETVFGTARIALTTIYWLGVTFLLKNYLGITGKSWIRTLTLILSFCALLLLTVISELEIKNLDTGSGMFVAYLLMRYLVFGSLLLLLLPLLRADRQNAFLTTVFHIVVLWIVSMEMTQWLYLSGNKNAYKLMLSILWGAYAIYLLFVGIKRGFVALRITGMAILGVTLVKLFFYDIARLSTISKTIVFIALGALLLVGAYFYQRLKAAEESDNPGE